MTAAVTKSHPVVKLPPSAAGDTSPSVDDTNSNPSAGDTKSPPNPVFYHRGVVPASGVSDARLLCDSKQPPQPFVSKLVAELLRQNVQATVKSNYAPEYVLVQASSDCQFIVWKCAPPVGQYPPWVGVHRPWVGIQPIFHSTVDKDEVMATRCDSPKALVDILKCITEKYNTLSLRFSPTKAAVMTVQAADKLLLRSG